MINTIICNTITKNKKNMIQTNSHYNMKHITHIKTIYQILKKNERSNKFGSLEKREEMYG